MAEENDNGGGNDGGKQFTPPADQAALDRIISDRLSRERAKFGDYDELKAKAEELDQEKAKNATELEKAQSRVKELETSHGELEGTLKTERIRSAVVRAGTGKVVDPDAAASLIDGRALEFDDDGKPTNVDTLLDALVKDKPYLKAPSTPARTRPKAPASRKEGEEEENNDNSDGKGRANQALADWIGSR